MNTLETLKAARKKIEDPKHWTREHAARFKNGKPAPSSHPHAYKFCAVGAITSTGAQPFGPECDALKAVVPGGYIADYNDTHTHSEVLAAFDEAIARLADACKQVTR